MSKFIIRVEVLDETDYDYSLLHELMAKNGCFQFIVGRNGDVFEMMPAEYHKYVPGSASAIAIRDELIAVITADLGVRFRIMVARYRQAAWRLAKISPPARQEIDNDEEEV